MTNYEKMDGNMYEQMRLNRALTFLRKYSTYGICGKLPLIVNEKKGVFNMPRNFKDKVSKV